MQISTNRVSVKGVKSSPPPPTTKVAITVRGGYHAEVLLVLVGLDIQENVRIPEIKSGMRWETQTGSMS